MALWTWIEGHQNLTVGIVGFVGVIFTLWFSAWQAREQRRDERRHEIKTLRAALIEELKINRETLVFNLAKTNEASETTGFFVPTDCMDDAYRAFIHRIGLLSQAEVRKVMFAYLSLRTYNAKLFLVGVPVETSDRHVNVPPQHGPTLSGMLKELIGAVDEAIKVMERAHDVG